MFVLVTITAHFWATTINAIIHAKFEMANAHAVAVIKLLSIFLILL
jgi:hypothetical protein